MAVGVYQPIVPFSPNIYTRGTVSLPEKASLASKKGAPIVYNAGYVEEAGATPATVRFIAAEDGHNGATDGLYDLLCWPIGADDLWEISMEDSAAIADHGAVIGIVKDATSGFWYGDDADAGDQIEVVRRVITPALGNIGDTKWRAIVKFQTANIASA